jgi:hypothetical protein
MQTEIYSSQNSLSEDAQTPVCQSCGATVAGQYCAACGQKYPQERLTMKELFHLAYESLFDFDRGFFHTLRELFLRPQRVIREYIAGRRNVYMNPVKYMLIWLGLSTLIAFSFLDAEQFTKQMVQESQWQPPKGETAEVKAARERMTEKMGRAQRFTLQNPQFVYAVLVPLVSLWSLLFFRKRGYTFAEHLLMNTYIMAQTIIIISPAYFFYYMFPGKLTTVTFCSGTIAVLYYTTVKTLVLGKTFRTVLKNLFSYVFAYLSVVIVSAIAFIAYVIYSMAK